MKCKAVLFITTLMITANLFTTSVFCAEMTGWIKSETCWVAVAPDKYAKTIGILRQKAVVTVEDLGNGWVKTINAPVRNVIPGRDGLKDGELYNCTDCYIEKKNISTLPPGRW